MASSPEFRALDLRLKELRHHLLPETFSPTGDYSDQQRDQAMGYGLLCHAEIESYIEQIALRLAKEKISTAENTKRASFTCMTLLVYRKAEQGSRDFDSDKQSARSRESTSPSQSKLGKKLAVVHREYKSIVASNHGIRRENLERILNPIGIDFSDLDHTWLTNMDEFGKQRGHIAHNPGNSVKTQIDPKTVNNDVTNILNGLKVLDDALVKLFESKD